MNRYTRSFLSELIRFQNDTIRIEDHKISKDENLAKIESLWLTKTCGGTDIFDFNEYEHVHALFESLKNTSDKEEILHLIRQIKLHTNYIKMFPKSKYAK